MQLKSSIAACLAFARSYLLWQIQVIVQRSNIFKRHLSFRYLQWKDMDCIPNESRIVGADTPGASLDVWCKHFLKSSFQAQTLNWTFAFEKCTSWIIRESTEFHFCYLQDQPRTFHTSLQASTASQSKCTWWTWNGKWWCLQTSRARCWLTSMARCNMLKNSAVTCRQW